MRSRHACFAVLAALAALSASACATVMPGRDEFAFQECQRRYTQYVRWARFDDASAFVQPEAMPGFLEQIDGFGDLRFTDYRIRSMDLDKASSSATVVVTYYAYTRTTPLPIALDETQTWEHVPMSRSWLVRSSFAQREVRPGEEKF